MPYYCPIEHVHSQNFPGNILIMKLQHTYDFCKLFHKGLIEYNKYWIEMKGNIHFFGTPPQTPPTLPNLSTIPPNPNQPHIATPYLITTPLTLPHLTTIPPNPIQYHTSPQQSPTTTPQLYHLSPLIPTPTHTNTPPLYHPSPCAPPTPSQTTISVPFQHFGNWSGASELEIFVHKVKNWEKFRSMKSAVPIPKHS